MSVSRSMIRCVVTAVVAASVSVTAFASPASAVAQSSTGPNLVTGPDMYGTRFNTESSLFYNTALGDNQVFATTQQANQAGVGLPVGRMSVLADLFKYTANGYSYLCNEAGYVYNDTGEVSVSTGTTQFCGAGKYYSRGVTRTYQGSYYISWYTFKSGDITAS